MPDYVRVKSKHTKHEFSVVASTFNDEIHTLLDKPATKADGTPLAPKYHKSLSSKGQQATSKSGQKADTEKES